MDAGGTSPLAGGSESTKVVIVPSAVMETVAAAAEATYPEECCGLLIGRGGGGQALVVSDVEPTRNVAPCRRHDRFEVDPQARFDLMRRLSGRDERIVGHYHSHPDHPALPSARDLEMAFEPDLIWLIVSVIRGRAVGATAHAPEPTRARFRRLDLRVSAA